MLDKIKEESINGLVVCPVGTGSAFAKKNFNSSFIIAKGGKTILFDCGATIPLALHMQGIKVTDFDAYYISHAHADHIGGFEETLFSFRYIIKKKPWLIINKNTTAYKYWNTTLRGGLEESESPKLDFDDLVRFYPLDDYDKNIQKTKIFDIDFEVFQTEHVPATQNSGVKMYSTGVLLDGNIFISGDSKFTPELFNDYFNKASLIFHDCQLFSPGLVHASYDELKTLPTLVRSKMYLYHYQDNYKDFKPEADGFRGFAKPWEIYR
jgi:ribonuclease BN (tRNA processing enzyme)